MIAFTEENEAVGYCSPCCVSTEWLCFVFAFRLFASGKAFARSRQLHSWRPITATIHLRVFVIGSYSRFVLMKIDRKYFSASGEMMQSTKIPDAAPDHGLVLKP